jgi:hypothetical protein
LCCVPATLAKPIIFPCQRIVKATGQSGARRPAHPAELLGQQATVFASHHGGFLGGESPYAGQPEAFARKLRDVLDENS